MGSDKKMATLWIAMIIASSMAVSTVGTMQEDEQECADQLANLAACIPYVSGTAKKPTPECCQDTQKVKANKPKCLCVLIKESTDPSMGLPVNTTLALNMPSACNIDAKVSDCPSILNLPPGSPDAKIFEAAGTDSSTTTSTTTSTADAPPSASASTSSGSSSSTSSSSPPDSGAKTGSKADSSSNNGSNMKLPWAGMLVMMAVASFMFIV